jgi:hypothetical protein
MAGPYSDRWAFNDAPSHDQNGHHHHRQKHSKKCACAPIMLPNRSCCRGEIFIIISGAQDGLLQLIVSRRYFLCDESTRWRSWTIFRVSLCPPPPLGLHWPPGQNWAEGRSLSRPWPAREPSHLKPKILAFIRLGGGGGYSPERFPLLPGHHWHRLH